MAYDVTGGLIGTERGGGEAGGGGEECIQDVRYCAAKQQRVQYDEGFVGDV